MKAFSLTGLGSAGVDRRRLKLGTVLGSGALAAALLVPAAAFAGAAPAQAQPGWVQSQLQALPGQDVFGPVGAPAPQDLTVRRPMRSAVAAVPNGDVNASYGDISTTADNTPGIYINSTGNTVITAGNITTSGNYSPAVKAVGAGNISLTVGNINTFGWNTAPGIVASAGGDIAITAGNIHTYDYGAPGFSGLSPGITASAGGKITITAGNITIDGGIFCVASPGISASAGSDIAITVGNVTQHTSGAGISADSGGYVTIQAQNVTVDSSFGGSGIQASGANGVNITVGDVVTSVYRYAGIVAYSSGGNVTVTVDHVSTNGLKSGGISAISNGGDTIIHNNGSVQTNSSPSQAIYAASSHGDVTIDGGGDVMTYGLNSAGVVAKDVAHGGSISITQGNILTQERYSNGISAYTQDSSMGKGVSNITIDVQNVTTNGGAKSVGILAKDGAWAILPYATGAGGQVDITVHGSVSTRGAHADGIYAVGYADNVNIQVGQNVSTRGSYSNGIAALGGQNVTIGVGGTVSTLGDRAAGVIAGGGGDVHITTGTVQTAGDSSSGIVAHSYSPSSLLCVYVLGCPAGAAGGVTISAGSITTAGKGSLGIDAYAYNGGATISVGSIATQGDGAHALKAKVYGGPISITETGSITTQGKQAMGIVAYDLAPYNGPGTGGKITITANSIKTAGDNSLGVYANSYGGDVVVNVKDVSTQGAYAHGVLANGINTAVNATGTVSTLGKGAVGLVASGYTATVQAATVTTAGDAAQGIVAYAGADATVTAGSVSTSGAGSTGVIALGFRNVTVDVQNVATTGQGADAIDATDGGAGALAVGVSGKVSASGAGSNGVVASNSYGATNITVASTGSVAGAIDAIQVQTGGGPVTVANAGTITGGTGFAVNVTGLSQGAAADTVIDNTGTIVGAVNLAGGGANTLTNEGTFVATKDSDFGGGQFVNTGVVKAAGSVSFLDLATFQNKGGLIDLRNGHAGDVFTLSGDYAASGGARLGLDVNAGAADKLVIAGTATGATSILLGVNPTSATLLAKPLTLAQAGAGSTGSFAIGNPDVGLIHYGLTSASGGAGAPVSYNLTASAGAPVYGSLKLEESAQTIWRQSADAWSEHLAAMRGDAWGGGQGSGSGQGVSSGSSRYWVQAYGSSGDRNETVGTGYGGVSVDYNQTDAGVQVGADVARRATRLGTVGWGVTAGYTNSQIDALGDTLKSNIDTFNVGGYAVLNHGPFFANALVKFDHHQISTSDSVAGYSANLSGSSFGAQFEFGRHFGTDRWAFEPTVSLNVVRTSLDNVSVLNQTLAFQDEDGVSGKIGGRFYTNRTFHNGTTGVFYAGAALVDDFTGGQKATFSSGGVSQDVSADGNGAYGQVVGGVSTRMRGVTLYLQGEGAFGGSHSGGGVRLGARF